jgi:hypothetical protein
MIRKALSATDAANIIERFLDYRSIYPQEWNDFVEGLSVESNVEKYRKRSYELDPVVNTPDRPNEDAIRELREMVEALRAIDIKK